MNFTLNKLILFFLLTTFSFSLSAQVVRMETVLGNIDIELRSDVAPKTVENFLNYVNDGDYDNSYIHRSINNFIIQGGGFNFIDGVGGNVPNDSPIVNESSLLNSRGTISMARTNDVNSAASQWFFNTANNTNLDLQQGQGYAVFGSVIKGMYVVDAIENLPTSTINLTTDDGNFSFRDVPYLNLKPSILTEDDAVLIKKAYVVKESNNATSINAGLNGAWYNPETSGQGILLEVYPNLDKVFIAWFTHDTEQAAEGVVANIGNAANRWFTALGDINYEANSITADLLMTVNGIFDNSQTVENTVVGSITLSFEDCENASVDYSFITPEISGSFDMKRIVGDNVELCQNLSDAIAK